MVFIIDSFLRDVALRGTAAKIGSQIPEEYFAGKTGTTNDAKDSWFVGFNRSIVVTVWVGYDDYTSLGRYESGSSLALPIWIEFMKSTKETRTPQPPNIINIAYPDLYGTQPDPSIVEVTLPPEGIVRLPINRETGDLIEPNLITPERITALQDPNPEHRITTSDPEIRSEYFLIEQVKLPKETQSSSDFFN